jgi:type I restriction enzyme M protein
VDLTQDEFNVKMEEYTNKLIEYFTEGNKLQAEILEQLKKVKYE